jgi:hypothetical protein
VPEITTKEQLPLRIAKLHNLFMHFGKPGRKLVKGLALYSLYIIFTNGGIEALSVICHEYMLNRVKENKENGNYSTNSTSSNRSALSSKN